MCFLRVEILRAFFAGTALSTAAALSAVPGNQARGNATMRNQQTKASERKSNTHFEVPQWCKMDQVGWMSHYHRRQFHGCPHGLSSWLCSCVRFLSLQRLGRYWLSLQRLGRCWLLQLTAVCTTSKDKDSIHTPTIYSLTTQGRNPIAACLPNLPTTHREYAVPTHTQTLKVVVIVCRRHRRAPHKSAKARKR